MTDHRSVPDPYATDRPSEDELGQVPEWLRQPAPEVPPGRADRLRITLGRWPTHWPRHTRPT
ncbi:hypothetical protein [Micromonospora sp. CNB394]|uniref:hypothetical protein n=1 Tax=Micromonospora sp. CNB394 TaxID=1169151 RepID=UPI00037C182B|nr:hypothetical protein [Micromonospora sp. CNB394]